MAVKQSGGVITWTVPLKSRSHKISFEHGTTTGRRVICVDDVEIRRQVGVVWCVVDSSSSFFLFSKWPQTLQGWDGEKAEMIFFEHNFLLLLSVWQNWMFKLVGSEEFSFLSNGQEHHATISIEPMGFNYSYTLLIDDKPLDSFKQNLRRTTQTWRFPLEGLEHSVVLGELSFPARVR